MRYYVVIPSQQGDVLPYIVAETVTDDDVDDDSEDADRSLTLAGGIAGPRARVVTERELLADPRGAQVLAAWNARDDTAFHAEGRLLAALDRPGRQPRHLILVRSAPEAPLE